MSGFAGIVRIAPSLQSAEVDRTDIERMARAIAFRGPDSLQQTHHPAASFAFSLLQTGPAPQEHFQPCTIDLETWFLGDVRCDGRPEIIEKLSQYGAEIASSATSESLILRYFAQFAEAGLPELDGDFSFVLWKPRERKLIAFRDLTGCKPFFFSHREGVLAFSNTIQAVLAVPSISRELDEEFLANFLLGAPYHDPKATAYRSIRRLPPGHLLEFSHQGLSIRRIANMPVEDVLIFKREEEYVEEFRRLLGQAVRDQLPSIDTTIFLSGGLDSTSIAACAVAQRKQGSSSSSLNLRSFSVDLQPLVDDPESALASRLAESLGVPHQVMHTGDALPFAGWEDLPRPFVEPVLDPYSDLYHSYYRKVAQDSRVALNGNGGDEVLRLRAWPYLLFLYKRDGPFSVLSTLSRYLISERKLPSLGSGIRSAFQRRFWKQSLQSAYPPWLAPDFERRLDLIERWRSMNSPTPSPHPFNPRAHAALNDLSVASALEFFDATWSGCQVEPRSPLLDRRLSRFLLRIPPIPWAMDKYLLRRSQIGILPDEIRLRPKAPLLHDALLLHLSSGKWSPQPPEPPQLMQNFVDWAMLLKFLKELHDESHYLHLRPVSLARWIATTRIP